MATFIPIHGETREIAPPKTRREIYKLLGVRSVQFFVDSRGDRWWYWREGHDHRNRNTRASEWLSLRGAMGKRILGAVLYESSQEVEAELENP